MATSPGSPQTYLVDLSIAQIRGVLGTSFAAPLFSGVGAMGLSGSELAAYVAAASGEIGSTATTPAAVTTKNALWPSQRN